MDLKATLSEGEWAIIRDALLIAMDRHFELAQTIRMLPLTYSVSHDEIVMAHTRSAEAAGNLHTKLPNILERA